MLYDAKRWDEPHQPEPRDPSYSEIALTVALTALSIFFSGTANDSFIAGSIVVGVITGLVALTLLAVVAAIYICMYQENGQGF